MNKFHDNFTDQLRNQLFNQLGIQFYQTDNKLIKKIDNKFYKQVVSKLHFHSRLYFQLGDQITKQIR